MKVTPVRTVACSPGRHRVAVRIGTDASLAGIGDAPGQGVVNDDDMAARYPYHRADLPVARLTDGTLWTR